MEEQGQLYQFYYYPERDHKLNFMPISKSYKSLSYPSKDYTDLRNTARFVNPVRPLSFTCLSRCRSNRSFVADESTPLLNANSKLPSTFSSNRRGILLSVFVVFYAGYLILGSITFRTFEMSEELKERQSYVDMRKAFSLKYPNVLGSRNFTTSFDWQSIIIITSSSYDWISQKNFSFVSDDDLEEFIENIVKVNGKGVSVLRNATGDLNWSFGQALIFSATVITTIGKWITLNDIVMGIFIAKCIR